MKLENIGEITGDWDFSTLPPNIRIGKRCFIERKEAFSRFRSAHDRGLVIGDGTQIYTWTTFNVEPAGRVEIGNNVILVGAVLMCNERINIGSRTLVSYNVTIADSDFHPHDPEERRLDAIANSPFGDRSKRAAFVSAPVTIGDDVVIGIGAIILKGVNIGDGAQIGAGAVVTKDVLPGVSVEGNPCRIVTP